ncbi:hypothetical protein DFH07DRAFT_997497 [Mycena maculata]|uniref:Novel STAND NTPase 1 domain-containing protein n=1 Tax=Mycena maculata TaxID=230809 RepID=A0AAD7P1K6_9AGAR|nr:hypothetical protein DFH07DRAFT_997497 [Mycena maculata]
MPLHSANSETRLKNIIESLNITVDDLEILSDSLKIPFLSAISNITRAVLGSVQAVRQNRNGCALLMEQIHKLLYGIITVHINSETSGELPPEMLDHIGEFTEYDHVPVWDLNQSSVSEYRTLHKVYSFIEAQQDKSRIRRFFRQGEMSTLLRECNAGLQKALEVFTVGETSLISDIKDFQQYAEEKHQEVLQLIACLSDGASSDRASSGFPVYKTEPKIFHGRNSEVSDVIKAFTEGTPRIAILGVGGIGKTSLARAVLHHPTITTQYQQHPLTTAELAALIGSHVGLKLGKHFTQSVVQHFSGSPASLLVLDNLETLWDSAETRGDVENFLSDLTDIPQLALIITMRGAERPARICWTRPFLLPLQPLSYNAAHQTFIDIAEDHHDSQYIDKILLLTDHMPLAIDLIAHLVDYEGCPAILSRWETEKIALLSEGSDRRSNLEISISLSLSSPRITALPGSKALLSLLSVLPDGLSEAVLLQSKVPIYDILSCKAALLRTSLGYIDDQKHLKVLVPIREYMQTHHHPPDLLIRPLLRHFMSLLANYDKYSATISGHGLTAQLAANFANIQNLLSHGLQNNIDLMDTIDCTISFDRFGRVSNRGPTPVMDKIPSLLPQVENHRLEVRFITHVFSRWFYKPIPCPEALEHQALEHFPYFDDLDVKGSFHDNAGLYYFMHNHVSVALWHHQAALSLSTATGNMTRQCTSLTNLSRIQHQLGNYSAGQQYATESLHLARLSGNLWTEAEALMWDAACNTALGNYKHAILQLQRASDCTKLCGLSDGQLHHAIMCALAEVHMAKSEYGEAHIVLTQILSKIPEDQFNHAVMLTNIADVGGKSGEQEDNLLRSINSAQAIYHTLDYPRGVTWCHLIIADMNLRQGKLIEAKSQFCKSLDLCQGENADIVTFCLQRLGNITAWTPLNWSLSWTTVFLAHTLRLKQKLEIHKAVQFLGDVFLAEDDENTAASLFTVALEGFTDMDVHEGRADCMLRLGDISKWHGDIPKATELWQAARPLFKRSSQMKQVAKIDEKLASTVHDELDKLTDNFDCLSGPHALPRVVEEQMSRDKTKEVQM